MRPTYSCQAASALRTGRHTVACLLDDVAWVSAFFVENRREP